MRDRVRGLSRIAGLGDPVADETVELGQLGSRLEVVDRGAVDGEQALE
jgi:hypothetical protein